MNKLIVSGRWCKDIELKYTPNGTAVAKSTIAVDSGYGDNKKTSFIDVDMWAKLAESTAQHSAKGRKILIEGRLEQQNWETDNGKRSKLCLVAEQIEFLDYADSNKTSEPQQQKTYDPFKDDGRPIDINEDDLPF